MAAYLFLLPTFVGLILFRLYPVINGVIESFHTTHMKGGQWVREYILFGNYIDLWKDPIFLNALFVSIRFVLLIVPIQVIAALFLAILLTRKKRGVSFIRSLYLIPIGVSVAISSVIWQIMLNPDQGIVNGLINLVGIPSQPFLTSKAQAMWCIILIASWRGVVYWMIFLVAGLKEIPSQLYEAAEIDGANLLQQIFKITIPLLKRIILFVAVVNTSTNFLLFSPIYITTRGGPQYSTNVLIFEAYVTGFIRHDVGRSMSITMILIALMLIIVGVQFRFLSSQLDSEV